MRLNWRPLQGREAGCRELHGLGHFLRPSISSAFLALVTLSQPVQAQSQPVVGALPESTTLPPLTLPAEQAPTMVPAPTRPQPRRGNPIINQGPPGPAFQVGATVNVSASYVTNATGLPGAPGDDYLTTLGFGTYLHEHSRRLSLDANYSFGVDLYAKNSIPTQISNNLQAVLSADVVPNYLSMSAKAFAQPIIISDLGIATADNRVVPNGFSNSYGYYVNPDLHFKLGDFATSETLPSFGQAFFTNPPGSLPVLGIPGLNFPQDTTSRGLTEKISSGPDFDRLNWDLVGSLSETAQTQSLLSEKAGIANLRYAVSHEFSLLATGGYDAISNSTGLNQDVSGPVAMGGFGMTFGKEFSLQVEAGQRYNDLSFFGNLRYEITPTAVLVAAVNDSVQTPEGQLLNNLTNLTARQDGSLGSAQDVYGNGTPSSLSSFNLQSQGSFGLDQNIARYQTLTVSFSEDFTRNHVSLNANATRRTILSGVFIGPPTTESWTVQAVFGRDLTPLLSASIAGSYGVDNQFGGESSTIGVNGQITYSLSRQTSIYLSAQYLNRDSSLVLQALSPFTGSLSDVRATIGLSHTL